MTDKKFTDEEIKSSLEVIATTRNCNECKIRNCKWGTCNCSQITANAALDLINRQKAEIEAIKDEKAMAFKLSEEQINEVKEYVLKSVEYNEREIKAEAYKEFAEKIKKSIKENVDEAWHRDDGNGIYDAEYVLDDIDNLLKEMVGEKE